MEIYQPAEDSYLLQKHVKNYALGRVLDMGTGSGIQAFEAIKVPDVREVVAVDINQKAVKELQKQIKRQKIRKIDAIRSDLFEEVYGKFNLILFNSPYLPQDEGINDPALYGGKQGWEVSERFFNKVSKYLLSEGKVLFLFSSLTKKEKIDELITNNLLEFEEIDKKKLPMFEELYLYLVKKSELLRQLESKEIENITYLTHGKRGNIFTGDLDKNKLIKSHFPSKKNVIKVGIKVKRDESSAIERISNETKWLKTLNKQGIGPIFLLSGDNYVIYKFVQGEFILDWINTHNKEEIKEVLLKVLGQCFIMDKLGVNKEEMHHPLKHVVVDGSGHPTLLDFERCSLTDKPQNVTQFVEFICRVRDELKNKEIGVNVKKLRELAKKYKESMDDSSFNAIASEINQ